MWTFWTQPSTLVCLETAVLILGSAQICKCLVRSSVAGSGVRKMTKRRVMSLLNFLHLLRGTPQNSWGHILVCGWVPSTVH